MRKHCQAHRRRSLGRRGMTLIEVLTVMTIMAVMLALAAPSFNRTVEIPRSTPWFG